MSDDRKLRQKDMRLIDDLFEMGGGYVLDFTNPTFAEFFHDELGVDIDAPRYSEGGTSKAKRLRYYLRQSNPDEVVRLLNALWDYRESQRRRKGEDETLPEGRVEFFRLIKRLGGTPPEEPGSEMGGTQEGPRELDAAVARELHSRLLEISTLAPHARGYAFERFLKQIFDANDLSARASFALTGEQIDGSFEAQGETYLLEAKWTVQPIGSGDLRSFNEKVKDKAAWSRGLFISDSGFSKGGLESFGRGKRVVCMDGLDLNDMLERSIHLSEVLRRKVRRAAETGRPFVRVRDLF